MTDEDDEDWSDAEEGDDAFWGWNPAWLPIALDGNGCHLVVELRAGDGYGVIGGLDPQANPRFEGINTWPSTAALLEHTANALHGKVRSARSPCRTAACAGPCDRPSQQHRDLPAESTHA